MWQDTTEVQTSYSDHTQSYEVPEYVLNAGDTGIITCWLCLVLLKFFYATLHLYCPPDTKVFPHLQVLLGKLGAMLRGEGTHEEMRAGSQHGRIWAWVQQPLGHT